MKKQYQVTLEEELVEKAKKLVLGSKLSPVLNSLLEVWVEHRAEVEDIINKDSKEQKDIDIVKKTIGEHNYKKYINNK